MTDLGFTAEIRFWWPGAPTAALVRWFEAGSSIAEESRTDSYWRTGTLEVGAKQRGGEGPCELKMRAAECPLEGGSRCADLWIKHEVDAALFQAETVSVTKHRRLRHFSVEEGKVQETDGSAPFCCEVELGRIDAGGEDWTTLCIEARAPVNQPLSILLPVWKTLEPPALLLARVASYPEFLLEMLGGAAHDEALI